jgi:hypothetical protein
VVSFGQPRQPHLTEVSVPPAQRPQLIQELQTAVDQLLAANIEIGQQHNAVNALGGVIANLKQSNFDAEQFDRLQKFVRKMDQVKRISVLTSANPVDFA